MKKILLLVVALYCSLVNGQTVTTLAGSNQGFVNATGIAAKFHNPRGVCVDASGNVYVADSVNHKIRKITPTGVVTTFAGSTLGYADGTGIAAQFDSPMGVCIDLSGNLYVADMYNHKIRKITPAGVVTTLAGSSFGYLDGTGSAAKFYRPRRVVCDPSGNVYVADAENFRIRKITPSGVVTTFAGSGIPAYLDGPAATAQFNSMEGLCFDASGNLYVADTSNSVIRKITTTGTVSTFAGAYGGYADGTGTSALFYYPTDICIDNSGYFYVADQANHVIRKISPTGVVTTLAGTFDNWGNLNGVGGAALFNEPTGVCVDAAGVVHVADNVNHRIRRISSTLSLPTNEVSNFQVKVYPNPAKTFLNIELVNTQNKAYLSICDILGKEVLTQQMTESTITINIGSYSKGTYIVTVNDGLKKTTQTLILE